LSGGKWGRFGLHVIPFHISIDIDIDIDVDKFDLR